MCTETFPDSQSGASLTNFLTSTFVLWQEGDKLHFVQVVDATEPLIYERHTDGHPLELRGYGYVILQTFKSSKDYVFIGYKDKPLWISAPGVQFNNGQFCSTETYQPEMELLRDYTGQRPPEMNGR